MTGDISQCSHVLPACPEDYAARATPSYTARTLFWSSRRPPSLHLHLTFLLQKKELMNESIKGENAIPVSSEWNHGSRGHISIKKGHRANIRAAIFCEILLLHVVRLQAISCVLRSFSWSLLLAYCRPISRFCLQKEEKKRGKNWYQRKKE